MPTPSPDSPLPIGNPVVANLSRDWLKSTNSSNAAERAISTYIV
jgi:hypothetical protein